MREKTFKCVMVAWCMMLLVILAVFYVPDIKWTSFGQAVSKIQYWTLVNEHNQKTTIELPNRINENTEGGIEIYTSLPEDFLNQQRLVFWSDLQDVYVYLDKELIYTNVDDEKRLGKAMASQWNYI